MRYPTPDCSIRTGALTLVMLALLAPRLLSAAQPAALPTPYPTTELTIDVWPRDPEKFAAGEVSEGNLDGIQIEIYNADATESVVSDGYRYHQYEIPQRVPVNTPALFRITDPVLDKAMLSYTAWEDNSTPKLKFTYPRRGGMGQRISIDDALGCDIEEPNRIGGEARIQVLDSLCNPSVYRQIGSLEGPIGDGVYEFDFLSGNALYPRSPDYFGFDPTRLTYFNFQLESICREPLDDEYLSCFEMLPEGPLQITGQIPGYSEAIWRYDVAPCDYYMWVPMIAPDGSDAQAISATDTLPSSYFPFPPPDVYTHMAQRELLLGRSIPFGYLKKAIDPDGTRIFDAASVIDQVSTGTITAEPMLALEDVSAAPGGSATIHLRLSGSVEDTLAFNATLSFSGVTTETLALMTVHGVPSAALAGGDFDEYQFLRHDGTLEYRLLGSALTPFDAQGNVDIATITVGLPKTVLLGSTIDVGVRTGIEDQTMLSSIVSSKNELIVSGACSSSVCVPYVRDGIIEVKQSPVTGWALR